MLFRSKVAQYQSWCNTCPECDRLRVRSQSVDSTQMQVCFDATNGKYVLLPFDHAGVSFDTKLVKEVQAVETSTINQLKPLDEKLQKTMVPPPYEYLLAQWNKKDLPTIDGKKVLITNGDEIIYQDTAGRFVRAGHPFVHKRVQLLPHLPIDITYEGVSRADILALLEKEKPAVTQLKGYDSVEKIGRAHV